MIYIAGPMTGIKEHNFPAFDTAAKRFRDRGWGVINPAEMDREKGIQNHTELSSSELAVMTRDFMRRDLNVILDKCTAIALLPGWKNSRGAAVEVALAKFIGLAFYCAETCEQGIPNG